MRPRSEQSRHRRGRPGAGAANAGTSVLQDVEVDLSKYLDTFNSNTSVRAISIMVMTNGGVNQYLASDGTLAQETGTSDYRPVFKIYS